MTKKKNQPKADKKENLFGTCNWCHKEFEAHVDENRLENTISVCTLPQCPAYALLQISEEQMRKWANREGKEESSVTSGVI